MSASGCCDRSGTLPIIQGMGDKQLTASFFLQHEKISFDFVRALVSVPATSV